MLLAGGALSEGQRVAPSLASLRARYSLAEGGWAIGRMRVGVGLNFIVLAALGSLGPASLEGIRP